MEEKLGGMPPRVCESPAHPRKNCQINLKRLKTRLHEVRTLHRVRPRTVLSLYWQSAQPGEQFQGFNFSRFSRWAVEEY